VDVAGGLGIALTIITIVLALAALYAVFVLIAAVKNLLATVEDVRSRLVPLLEKADVTVDAVNAELLRLDAIVTQAAEVGDVVSTASGIIRSPVNSAANGIARLIRAFGKR
jgi:ABC-type transporter Mla subunit MlaD